MWVYCTDKSDGRYIALFDYSPTRNGDNAAKFLGDYSGYLVCDGYDATTSLKRSQDADAGRMRGESSLKLYPQTRSLFPHQQLRKA